MFKTLYTLPEPWGCKKLTTVFTLRRTFEELRHQPQCSLQQSSSTSRSNVRKNTHTSVSCTSQTFPSKDDLSREVETPTRTLLPHPFYNRTNMLIKGVVELKEKKMDYVTRTLIPTFRPTTVVPNRTSFFDFDIKIKYDLKIPWLPHLTRN